MSTVIAVLGDDVSTDAIYPGRFMATVLPSETPKYAFADDKTLNGQLVMGDIPNGSVVVGGTNFGCGSSREQAVSCLKGHELTVVAKSFGRIFLQNAINLGLNIVICPELEASPDDEIQVVGNRLANRTTKKSYAIQPLPPSRQAIIDAGGLIAYTRNRLREEQR